MQNSTRSVTRRIAASQHYARFTATLVASLLAAGLWLPARTAQAQVTPAPSSLPGPVSRPGAVLPGTVQPGRTGTLPNQTTQPGRTNTQPGQPGQPGRQGTLTPTNQPNQPGRTNGQPGDANQVPGQGQTGTTPDGQTPADQQLSDQAEQEPKTEQEIIEDGYEAARRREREELRRKLFGYELFSNPGYAGATAPSATVATPRGYVIGPGDQLSIVMYGYTEGEFSQTVSREGAIYFANQTGIGPVYVSGLSVEAAKVRIESRLATKYVGLKNGAYGAKNTYLDVTLGALRGIRVSVTGEALRPGGYTVSSLATALNVIITAGGPDVLGSMRRVNLIRGNKVVTTLDLYDYLLTGIQRNDVSVKDGDVIRFGRYLSRVEITGTVNRNNIFELEAGETLDKLLFYAGDFAANAYKNRLKVTRLTDRERRVVDITADQFKTFVMKDGDVVSVEQLLDRFENQVSITGSIYRPGKYALEQSPTLKTLIQNADGLREDAFTGRAKIIRTRADLATENIPVNLADIINGTAADVPLQREDQVIVTSKFDLAEIANISIQGEVNRPSEGVPYVANMTLEDLILQAGGLKEAAANAQVEIVRRKRDVDITKPGAETADIFRYSVNRDLTLNADDTRFLLEPFDQVVVRRSPNYQVQSYARVEGEVVMPGQYPLRSRQIRISDLIQQSGGLSPFAYVEGATLQRPVKQSSEELALRQRTVSELADDERKAVVQQDAVATGLPENIGINLKQIVANPGGSEDIFVEEGDILRIPRFLETVRVQGEVFLPTTAKFRTGQTFENYISQAGGYTDRSVRRRAYVVYANGSADRTRKFMFFNIYPRVEPGSEIFVPTRTSNPLTPQQVIQQATTITTSVMTLILAVLAFRSVR